MRIRICLFSVASLWVQCALAQDCFHLSCGNDESCQIAPARLTASLPAGLEIKSIGGNTRIAIRGEAVTADCSSVARLPSDISMDRATLVGSLRVAGSFTTSGVLRYEPNDGGALEFRPGKEIFKGTGKFFAEHFKRIKLDETEPAVRLSPPASLAKADCWQVHATAALSGFSLFVHDSSSAGTYAKRASITAHGKFSQCEWGGE